MQQQPIRESKALSLCYQWCQTSVVLSQKYPVSLCLWVQSIWTKKLLPFEIDIDMGWYCCAVVRSNQFAGTTEKRNSARVQLWSEQVWPQLILLQLCWIPFKEPHVGNGINRTRVYHKMRVEPALHTLEGWRQCQALSDRKALEPGREAKTSQSSCNWARHVLQCVVRLSCDNPACPPFLFF